MRPYIGLSRLGSKPGLKFQGHNGRDKKKTLQKSRRRGYAASQHAGKAFSSYTSCPLLKLEIL